MGFPHMETDTKAVLLALADQVEAMRPEFGGDARVFLSRLDHALRSDAEAIAEITAYQGTRAPGIRERVSEIDTVIFG